MLNVATECYGNLYPHKLMVDHRAMDMHRPLNCSYSEIMVKPKYELYEDRLLDLDNESDKQRKTNKHEGK